MLRSPLSLFPLVAPVFSLSLSCLTLAHTVHQSLAQQSLTQQPLAQQPLAQQSPQEAPLQQAPLQQALFLAYPPDNHETVADRIFLIGTAAPEGVVRVNGAAIDRSVAGHFAPTFPLEIGKNAFTLQYQDQEINLTVTRIAQTPVLPQNLMFAEDSLMPAVDMARLPGEWVCFGAIATANATVTVQLGSRSLPLTEEQQVVTLPSNFAALVKQNDPQIQAGAGHYRGCTQFSQPMTVQPEFRLSRAGQTFRQQAKGTIEILDEQTITIAEVTAESGTARTGPSTTYSRLTPLPQDTQARVTGREGDWLRLDYGAGNSAWIQASETRQFSSATLPHTMIRSVISRQVSGWTEVVFPLQVPIPITIQQDTTRFILTLHNTTAQTDTIYVSDDPLIQRLNWQQPHPGEVSYTFDLKTPQQWGYKVRYEGTRLILALKHPPTIATTQTGAEWPGTKPMRGLTVFIDPGHGSENDLGARGPTGYPEKDVALIIAQRVRDELQQLGATVYLAREGDDDLWPHERVAMIEAIEPDLAISLHYNALPDQGDAMNTQGIGGFWYHPQAHDLTQFLHDYLVETLDRPSYGVFWNNLALTRPTVTPAVLLELGFMINPEEFEWIVDPQAQRELAQAIAQGIAVWVDRRTQLR